MWDDVAGRKPVAGMRALGGTNDGMVVVPGDGETVTAQHVRDALDIISWPECYSRKNVTPDDAQRRAHNF